MSVKNNLIESFVSRRREQVKSNLELGQNQNLSSSLPIDMTQRRKKALEMERRTVKRTILSEFIGAHIVVPHQGLKKVAFYDISEGGLAFDVSAKDGQLNKGEEVRVRVYLNHKTYFPFDVKVADVRFIPEEDIYRHGASYVKDSFNNVALKHFVGFLETVSAGLKTDGGDVMVSNLRG